MTNIFILDSPFYPTQFVGYYNKSVYALCLNNMQ